MRVIERTTRFQKDYKCEAKGRHSKTLDQDLLTLFKLLISDQPLPLQYRDHSLSGEWADHQDCHLKPDDKRLQLVRLGSHSELGF